MKTMPLTSMLEDAQIDMDGFCKKLTGIMGEGAFPLRIKNGRIYSAGTELSPDQFREKINGQYLLQERITQHEIMDSLHPHSVNTIRMITFNNDGKTDVLRYVAHWRKAPKR